MLNSVCNKKGMGIVEVLIAIFLTSVGIMALLSFQPDAWRTQARADYMGRASGILQKTLEEHEHILMNPCNTVPADQTVSVNPSGNASAVYGDITYTVNTTVTGIGVSPLTYLVTVTVTWTNNTTGTTSSISESMITTRQELHRFPAGCANAI